MPDTIPPTDTTDDESEAAPEIPDGPSRGRPRVTPPYWDDLMRQAEKNTSRRTHIKRFHTTNALDALEGVKGVEYVTGSGDKGEGMRIEILAELGRLNDPATIRAVAAQVCEHRMKVKDAVAMIRTWRNGGAAPGDTLALANEIVRVVHSYRLRHPATTDDQVRLAFRLAGREFTEGSDGSDDVS